MIKEHQPIKNLLSIHPLFLHTSPWTIPSNKYRPSPPITPSLENVIVASTKTPSQSQRHKDINSAVSHI
ncbi:hypothetical protein P168DRAFT_287326 [Aspergillus campestris IBT 28561]|uniref:Uncharacterized protein n=1 Tax=Aspergillus campestris (strain IBT 28561) TaxID=1392248 RepID=A0A2I1DHB9_ASPC2|nr:uncharacterized protein P168DRAFT_287326 [Aspergillus campestris IBT 28561]PKY09267.1 hypothetical protein P168DRAFT_287326 [Aspergillus campestris IBT 28561]